MWATKEDELSVDAPCLWPIVGDCAVAADDRPEIARASEQMAIDILHAASGRQFGECVVTYQPCRRECAVDLVPVDMWSLIDIRHQALVSRTPWSDGYYSTMVCSNCRTDDCACTDLVDIELWHRNITSVMEVKIDGAVLDPGNWRLFRGNLVRTDGLAWPECQDATVPNGSVGTWSISYRHGKPVPPGGQVAAGILACEFAKAMCNDSSCALPKRVQSITRQGVSVAFLDAQEFLDQGKTGIYTVDLWLHSVNPNRLARRARAYSPAKLRRGRTRDAGYDPFPAP